VGNLVPFFDKNGYNNEDKTLGYIYVSSNKMLNLYMRTYIKNQAQLSLKITGFCTKILVM